MYSQERLLTLCEVGDRVRILKYKRFFVKGNTPIWCE